MGLIRIIHNWRYRNTPVYNRETWYTPLDASTQQLIPKAWIKGGDNKMAGKEIPTLAEHNLRQRIKARKRLAKRLAQQDTSGRKAKTGVRKNANWGQSTPREGKK